MTAMTGEKVGCARAATRGSLVPSTSQRKKAPRAGAARLPTSRRLRGGGRHQRRVLVCRSGANPSSVGDVMRALLTFADVSEALEVEAMGEVTGSGDLAPTATTTAGEGVIDITISPDVVPGDLPGDLPTSALVESSGDAAASAALDSAGAAADALTAAPAPTEAIQAAAEAVGSAVATDPSVSDTAAAAAATSTQAIARYDGWLSPLSNGLENVLGVLQHGLETLHVPYSYGFSIILLTVLVRTATYPLTKKQAEVSMATMQLKPTIDRIKRRYGDDKERIQIETGRLYEKTKINPLAGCLPSFASIPIFLGLYYSLGNVANEGQLENEGFFWIPSLAGPVSLAARKSGSGTAWLFPFEDGHPPGGWDAALPYLILPVLLVVIQYVLSALITPPKDPEDKDENKQLQIIVKLLPLMLGWFSLNVPAGLTLYYFSNISLVSAQQIYLRKLGGAQVDLGIELPEEKFATGVRRNRQTVPETADGDGKTSKVVLVDEDAAAAATAAAEPVAPAPAPAAEVGSLDLEGDILKSVAAEQEALEPLQAAAASTNGASSADISEASQAVDRICKRKRRVPAPGSALALMQKSQSA